MATPIWKDYTVDLGTTDGQTFTIYDAATSSAIYTGKAYIRPGDTHAFVKVNDICADYMAQKFSVDFAALQGNNGSDTNIPAARTFLLQVGDTVMDSWTFYLNYEYKDGAVDKQGATVNVPITGRLQKGMFGPLTCLLITNYKVVTISTGSGGMTVNVGRAPFNYYHKVPASATRLSLSISNGPSITYAVTEKCHRYALYYVNALGGLDVLVMEGRYRIKDEIERNTYKKTYDNGGIEPGEVNYLNGITRTWELHTGWLTDAEAGRMGHLLGSPLVYLCDCDDNNRLYPVIISNREDPHKTHKDGMVSYQVDVRLAQDMIRR